ncbi:MAG: NUDIX hydrolase [Chromatiales bacterium]|jgi:8-oxo-dGTP pyrophosphatase MutT (NUDIX family)|nr:NUDIX hydrolase [Chromatiales bacterium]
MNFHPDITVASIIERDGRFLMVEEIASGLTVINQPAGHLERGETLQEAAVRETLEETAWNIHTESVVGVYLWQNPVNGRSFLRVTFAGKSVTHEPWRGLDEGICGALWMSRDDIVREASRLRSPMVLRCVDDYLCGQRYPLEMLRYIVSPEQTPMVQMTAV